MKHMITWSIEADGGGCPYCGTTTVLLIAAEEWHIAEEHAERHAVPDEVSGHFCRSCNRLVSLSLNTQEPPKERQ